MYNFQKSCLEEVQAARIPNTIDYLIRRESKMDKKSPVQELLWLIMIDRPTFNSCSSRLHNNKLVTLAHTDEQHARWQVPLVITSSTLSLLSQNHMNPLTCNKSRQPKLDRPFHWHLLIATDYFTISKYRWIKCSAQEMQLFQITSSENRLNIPLISF